MTGFRFHDDGGAADPVQAPIDHLFPIQLEPASADDIRAAAAGDDGRTSSARAVTLAIFGSFAMLILGGGAAYVWYDRRAYN